MMYINIYKDQMQKAYLFGTAVLYSDKPIPQEDVPQDWFSYELRGTVQFPDEPYALEDKASYNYAGSVLSPLPLKKDAAQSRLVKDKFGLVAEHVRLADFCSEYHIPTPQTPIRHMLRPASTDEAGLFYALEPEEDEKLGVIGHVRIDFGRSGDEFRHSWWPRGSEELNTPEFREELGKVVDDLRKPVFTQEDHRRLHDLVPDSEGYVVVSYNDDVFIRDMYRDCYILAFTRQNTMSQKPGAKFGELLITNFDPRPIIEINAQLSIFGDLPSGLELVNIPN